MILAGDVGGTKTNLGLFERGRGTGCGWCAPDKFHSPDFPGLSAVIHALPGRPGGPGRRSRPPASASPGRWSRTGRALPTSPGWWTAPRIGRGDPGARGVALINDLVATAEGIPLLEADEAGGPPGGEPGAGRGTGR